MYQRKSHQYLLICLIRSAKYLIIWEDLSNVTHVANVLTWCVYFFGTILFVVIFNCVTRSFRVHLFTKVLWHNVYGDLAQQPNLFKLLCCLKSEISLSKNRNKIHEKLNYILYFGPHLVYTLDFNDIVSKLVNIVNKMQPNVSKQL